MTLRERPAVHQTAIARRRGLVAVTVLTGLLALGCTFSSGGVLVSGTSQLIPQPSSEPPVSPGPSLAVHEVPASIDATGATDVAPALQRFVDRVPDGSLITFPQGAVYQVSHGIRLTGRHELVFDGRGATLLATGDASGVQSSLFLLADRNVSIVIQDFILVGSNPDAGTAAAYHPGLESQMGVAIYGGTNVTIRRVEFRDLFGDCVYVSSTGTSTWSDGVAIEDSACRLTGRHGVAIIAGEQVSIERSDFDEIGMSVVDIEPDLETQGARDVSLLENTVGSYGLNTDLTSWLLAAEGAEGASVTDVEVARNTITGTERSGHEGKALGLHVTVRARGPRADFAVHDNTSTRMVVGPSMQFIGVQGVSVVANVQPLSSGGLVRSTGSTDVVIQDNLIAGGSTSARLAREAAGVSVTDKRAQAATQ